MKTLEQVLTAETQSATLLVGELAQLEEWLLASCRALAREYPLLYISFNHRVPDIQRTWQQQQIVPADATFVETMPQTSDQPQANVIVVENMADLTGLQLALSRFCQTHRAADTVVIVDALATLLLYNRAELVVRFTRELVTKTRAARTLVFTPPVTEGELLSQVSPLFDTVIR